MKKLLVSLLSLLLTFSLLMPIVAEDSQDINTNLVESETTVPNTNESEDSNPLACDATEAVACVGETGYELLSDAIKNSNGQTVVLTKDTKESVTIESDLTLTINDGVTLTNEEGKHTITVKSGTLTINGTGTIDNISHMCAALLNEKGGTGTVIVNDEVKFTRSKEAGTSAKDSGGNSWYVIRNYGTMTFNGGNVHSTGKFSSLVDNYGTMTINDGEFSNGFIAVKSEEGTKLTINGGNFNGSQSVQTYGDTLITGGILSGDVSIINYQNYPSTTTFEGGELISGDVVIWDDLYQKGDFESTAEISLTINNVDIKKGGIKVKQTAEDKTTTEIDIEKLENVKTDVTGGTFGKDVSKYANEDTIQAKGGSKYAVGKESTEALASQLSDGEVLEITSAPVGTSLTLPEGTKFNTKVPVSINGTLFDANTQNGIAPSIPEEKPSKPDHNWVYRPSYNDSKDEEVKEYTIEDKTKACIELLGKGWEYSEKNKSCVYTLDSNTQQIPNTSTK